MNSPVLFPKTLLDIKVTSETIIDLYKNCGLPERISEKLFADLSPSRASRVGRDHPPGPAGRARGDREAL